MWGHSQGGNSALFTAARAHAYAPELHLVATVASAPAAELVPLLNQTYNSTLAWVIGPEVLTSWPATFPGLPVRSILTSAGYNNYQRIAQKCITTAAAEGLVRNAIKQRFFNGNPVNVAQWKTIAQEQTAPVLAPSQPLLVAESLTDQVVLPNTTALYIQRACAAGSDLTSLWLTDVGHIQLSSTIAPEVINWLGDRFAGRPTAPTCNQPCRSHRPLLSDLWPGAGLPPGTVDSGRQADGEGLEPSEHDVLLVEQLVGDALEAAGPAQQGRQRDLCLEPGQRRAQAVVDAEAEAQVVVVGPRHVEGLRGRRRRRGRGWPTR